MSNVILERIAFICAGNHNRSGEVRKRIIRVVELLQEHQRLFVRDLAKHLDCNISTDSGKAQFYSAIMPLRGKNPLDIQFIRSHRDSITSQVYYRLSPDAFHTKWHSLEKGIENKLTIK